MAHRINKQNFQKLPTILSTELPHGLSSPLFPLSSISPSLSLGTSLLAVHQLKTPSSRANLLSFSLKLRSFEQRAIMILDCSWLLPHRHPPSVSHRFQFVPRRFEILGGSVSLPNLKKLFLSIQDSRSSIPSILFINSAISKYNQISNEQLAADMQKPAFNKGMLALPLLWTNVLMLAAPSEALAETCEAENSMFTMPILLFVALVGATVGGLLARQRKEELQKVNEQLRQINAALRRQAKIESYAPSLSYAPVGGSGRIAESEVVVDPRKEKLMSHLKTGKNYLRNQDPEKAYVEFKAGLELAQQLNDPIEEKKAARGLGASLQRQGKYRDAVTYHSLVLEISKRQGEDSGNTEAYGAIADCYTELGDLERAGKYYDEYIARLETD